MNFFDVSSQKNPIKNMEINTIESIMLKEANRVYLTDDMTHSNTKLI